MSYKFSGHTMGMPKCDIYEAIDLTKAIGYDGLEVRIAADGQIDTETVSDAELARIRKAAQFKGLEFSCLTSYYQDFASLTERDSVLANLRKVVDAAEKLDCRMVRVYGGTEASKHPEQWFTDVWGRTASGIRETGLYAAMKGVKLCIETHIGSLTMSLRDTLRMVEDVAIPNVGVLFDYAWVELAGVEYGAEAVRKVAPHLSHIHIKDWKLESRAPLAKTSCLMGEGTVAWAEVLPELAKLNADCWISDEYEKYWYPEALPEPEVGMKHNLDYVKSFLL